MCVEQVFRHLCKGKYKEVEIAPGQSMQDALLGTLPFMSFTWQKLFPGVDLGLACRSTENPPFNQLEPYPAGFELNSSPVESTHSWRQKTEGGSKPGQGCLLICTVMRSRGISQFFSYSKLPPTATPPTTVTTTPTTRAAAPAGRCTPLASRCVYRCLPSSSPAAQFLS